MPAKGNIANLNPIKSVEEAREKGRKGGIASGEARRLKASMREVATKWMLNRTSIKIDGQKATGEEVCGYVFDRVMTKADATSVELIKTFAKVLDGETMEITGNLETTDLTKGMTTEKKRARIAEILAKRKGEE